MLSEGAKIEIVPIESIHSFNILDPAISRKIDDHLDATHLNQHNLHKLSMIYKDIESPVQLKVRYSLQIMGWESSYCMDLSSSPHLKMKPIIENTTNEDWNDITLALIVGTPIIKLATEIFIMKPRDKLLCYEIHNVTAKRNQKVILPPIQIQVEGQKFLFYNERFNDEKVLQAIVFKYATGHTLKSGPITIISNEEVLGCNFVPPLPPDGTVPIHYAVAQDCEVKKEVASGYLLPHQFTIKDGIVETRRVHRVVTYYKIQNQGNYRIDFLLNHIILKDYVLAKMKAK